MNNVLLGLGSNLKSPERQMRQALNALKSLPQTVLLGYAPFYHNPAWGRKAQPSYVNTVALLVTRLPPLLLLHCCQAIETVQGRVRTTKWGARTLDIDILFYGTRSIDHPLLTVPHPYIQLRPFVHQPLSALLHRMRNKLSVSETCFWNYHSGKVQ